jgi:hypothetical protein
MAMPLSYEAPRPASSFGCVMGGFALAEAGKRQASVQQALRGDDVID